MGRHTTIEERKLIIFHYENNKTFRKISEICNKPLATVQHIIERYKQENRINSKTRISPKKIFTPHDERWIVRKIRENPKLSAPKLTNEVEKYLGKKVNPETVRRVLRKENFNGRVARKKPYISNKNKRLRINYAKEHLNKDIEFWKTVIFSDESKFNLMASDGRVMVWRKPNEELKLKNLQATIKKGGGHVMVWGCVSWNGVGALHFIEGNMNKHMYLDILKQHLKASAEKMGLTNTFRFYQDNDPKHTSYLVKEWLLYNCPNLMKPPPQSPDLNIIENLWAKLETEIRKHTISNKQDLRNALQEEWSKITPDYIRKYVLSIPNRLQLVLRSKGNPTKY